MTDTITPPPLRGVHHLKFAVSDLDRALRWYETAWHARRIVGEDHIDDRGVTFAYVLDVPGLGTALELRRNPDQAARHRWFDAVTVAVDDHTALVAWSRHLTAVGVANSGVRRSLQAWVVVTEDPDGNRLRLYSLRRRHSPEPPDTSPWLDDRAAPDAGPDHRSVRA